MQKREKILLAAASLVVTAALIVAAYVTFSNSGGNVPTKADNPHFAVRGISSQLYYAGEDVIIACNVTNDEPDRETAVPTVMSYRVTADPNNASSRAMVTTGPTIVAKMVPVRGTHEVIAVLKGDNGVSVTRKVNLTLSSNETRGLAFDFGSLPAGAYVATVTARSYDDSVMSKAISVHGAPALDDWTVTGDVAFMMVNLSHEGVDVKIRNDGTRAKNFSGSQYRLFANVSEDNGVALEELNQTMVPAGKTVTVRMAIPSAGSYYLDHFAVRVPGRAALLKIAVKAWMNETA